MEKSRRLFLKHLGLAGLAPMNLPVIAGTATSEESSQEKPGAMGTSILFQGDSITDGMRTRDEDWNHIMGHGYAYLVASRLWHDHPEKNFHFYNRGNSGDRIRDLEERWQKDALELEPDIISILIGVNDVIAIVTGDDPESAAQFEARYQRLLDRTRKALPNTKIVLCEPFILPLGRVDQKPRIWETEIPVRQQITRKIAHKNQAVFVELQQAFTDALQNAPAEYWIWDGVHPMPAGHELIARHWIAEVNRAYSLF